jgi:hypothetical protein
MKRLVFVLACCVLSAGAWAGIIDSPRKSGLEKALNVILATAVPQLSAALRERIVRDYEDADANKALAVELVSGNTWRSPAHEDQSVAGDRTLEGCQLRFGKPCALLAVNEEIAAEGQLISKDMPRLQYAGEFDLSQIPIMRQSSRNKAFVQNYFGAAGPKAMAILPWGKFFTSTGKNSLRDAEDDVLARCNDDPARKGRDGNCFLYAINNDVVLAKRMQVSPSGH